MALGARTRRLSTVAVLAVCVVAIGACGGSDSSTSTPGGTAGAAATPAVDRAAAAKVPAAVKRKGKLTIAADATYAPNEFIGSDGHTVQGMDADLAHALGGVLGLKANVVNATFDSIIPGLVSHKFDLGMSSMTDTKAREKTLDFVTYFSAGTSFYEKSNGPPVNGLPDLCGKTVAVEKGTTQAADATAQSAKCRGAKVSVLTFPDQNGANLALASGRAQVGMADSPVAAYQVKQSHGQFKLTGTPYGTAPYGIAIPKGDGMAPALQAAVTKLIKGGQYGAILRRWGIVSGAIGTPVVNGATS